MKKIMGIKSEKCICGICTVVSMICLCDDNEEGGNETCSISWHTATQLTILLRQRHDFGQNNVLWKRFNVLIIRNRLTT